MISAGRTWFPPGDGGKGVERRAGRLTWEYKDKLKNYDNRFHAAQRRGEDFHKLLKFLAHARCAAIGRARGWEAGPRLLGKVMGEVRRATSVHVVRRQASCLLERLSHLAPGVRAAAEGSSLTSGGDQEEGGPGLKVGPLQEGAEQGWSGICVVNL